MLFLTSTASVSISLLCALRQVTLVCFMTANFVEFNSIIIVRMVIGECGVISIYHAGISRSELFGLALQLIMIGHLFPAVIYALIVGNWPTIV